MWFLFFTAIYFLSTVHLFFIFVVGSRVVVVSLLAVVALLSADFSKKNGLDFIFVSCGSDGGI